MGIYIGGAKDYSAMRGPCPEGFHIPSRNEWQSLITLLTNAQIIGSSSPWGSGDYRVLKTALKLPLGGYRHYSSSNISDRGSLGFYWSSTAAYGLVFGGGTFLVSSYDRTNGFPIRPFSDTVINPMEGEILKDGWEYLDGNTMAGNVCAWNPTLKVISIVYNSNQVITIADRNLGATTTYDWDIYEGGAEPTLSEANCGKYYQWGNNYGFPYSGSVTTSSTKVNASSYGPGNYYSSSTFIIGASGDDLVDWSSVQNDNLRGGVTGTKPLMLEIKNAYIGYPQYTPNEDTLFWITNNGEISDHSPYSHAMSWYGTEQYTTLPNGRMVAKFTGSNAIHSDTFSEANSYTTFTLHCWVKKTSTSSSEAYLVGWMGRNQSSSSTTDRWGAKFQANASSSNWHIIYGTNGQNDRYKNTNVSTTISTSQFDLMTFTVNGATVSLYKNASFIGTRTGGGSIAGGSTTGTIFYAGGNYSYNGSAGGFQPCEIGEIVMEKKVETQSEITEYYNLTKSNYGS